MSDLTRHRKRQWVWWFAVFTLSMLAILAAIIGLWFNHIVDQNAPRFVPGAQVAEGKVFCRVLFSRSDIRLFDDKLLIVAAQDCTTSQILQYLINAETGEVRGTLSNDSGYSSLTPDGRYIVSMSLQSRTISFPPRWLKKWLQRNKPQKSNRGAYVLIFWLVPLDGGPAKQIARESDFEFLMHISEASPNRRYILATLGLGANFIIDLEKRRRIELPRTPYDGNMWWWSNTELLQRNAAGDLEIVDLSSQRKRTIMTSSDIETFVLSQGLPAEKQSVAALGVWDYHHSNNRFYYNIRPLWNGHDYTFYLSGKYLQSFPPATDWLLKLHRETESLEIVCRQLYDDVTGAQFEDTVWRVYSGTSQNGDMNAVYLRDMTTTHVMTLVPPDPQANQFSMPSFLGPWIIFNQNNAVWRMKRDGTEQRQVFPPVEP